MYSPIFYYTEKEDEMEFTPEPQTDLDVDPNRLLNGKSDYFIYSMPEGNWLQNTRILCS